MTPDEARDLHPSNHPEPTMLELLSQQNARRVSMVMGGPAGRRLAVPNLFDISRLFSYLLDIGEVMGIRREMMMNGEQRLSSQLDEIEKMFAEERP
jgi:hypothetical protein